MRKINLFIFLDSQIKSLAKSIIPSAERYSYFFRDGIILADEYQVNSSVVTK